MARRKKKNYRLRKSVRRTFGALFMISAIIIAAIPFPDAAATNGFETVSGNNPSIEDDPSQVPLPELGNEYSYTQITDLTNAPNVFVNENNPNDEIKDIVFKKLDTDEANGYLHKAMYIRKTSDGKDNMLVRQFDFVSRVFPDKKPYGIITKYYDTFTEPEIILNSSVVTDYRTETQTGLEAFYADNTKGGKIRTFDKEDTLSDTYASDEAYFKEFFPSEYEKYCEEYNAYLADKVNVSKPEDMESNPAGLSDVNRLKYYCWYHNFIGYTLTSVIDKASDETVENTDGSDARIYVMKAINGYPRCLRTF